MLAIEYESEQLKLNVGIKIDTTTQKSIESTVDENIVISHLGSLITVHVRPILKLSTDVSKLSLSCVN